MKKSTNEKPWNVSVVPINAKVVIMHSGHWKLCDESRGL